MVIHSQRCLTDTTPWPPPLIRGRPGPLSARSAPFSAPSIAAGVAVWSLEVEPDHMTPTPQNRPARTPREGLARSGCALACTRGVGSMPGGDTAIPPERRRRQSRRSCASSSRCDLMARTTPWHFPTCEPETHGPVRAQVGGLSAARIARVYPRPLTAGSRPTTTRAPGRT